MVIWLAMMLPPTVPKLPLKLTAKLLASRNAPVSCRSDAVGRRKRVDAAGVHVAAENDLVLRQVEGGAVVDDDASLDRACCL